MIQLGWKPPELKTFSLTHFSSSVLSTGVRLLAFLLGHTVIGGGWGEEILTFEFVIMAGQTL